MMMKMTMNEVSVMLVTTKMTMKAVAVIVMINFNGNEISVVNMNEGR
jgi:hypothetical protein